MRFRLEQTILIILSTAFILVGLYAFFFGGNLGPLAAILPIAIGGVFLFAYFFQRKGFKH